MTKAQIRQMTKELMQPIFDQMVDNCCIIYEGIIDGLKDYPDSEKEKIVNDIIDRHSKGMLEGLKAGMPDNFVDKIKEYTNGRK
jgi:hypothetical protein